jgi:signal transduction histidine kinase
MIPRFRWQTAGYVFLLVGAFVLAMLASYTPLGRQIDSDAYDWMFRLHSPALWKPQSAILAIDEATLLEEGGIRRLRKIVADGLECLSKVSPKVVAIDLTLAESGEPADDARLEAAMQETRNLVLTAEMLPDGTGWQEPIARFRRWAAAVGHAHAAPDELDGVNRRIPLEKAAGRKRYWALAFEAFRLSQGSQRVLESPEDLRLGNLVIPSSRNDSRSVLIRYLPEGSDGSTIIPHASVRDLLAHPGLAERFRGKTVFLGVTAQSAARDRLMTPLTSSRPMPGVEVHANAFETLAHGRFLTVASNLDELVVCFLLVVIAGLTFVFLSGWLAYSLGAVLLVAAHTVPYALFTQDLVFPYMASVAAAWLSVAGAASYQHFVVRRQLRSAEAERTRYQQAVHFVTHEMRTPLTAIQGSSELMSRYNLNDEKRRQIAGLIHSESRRLARMIETFLNVERLSAGQMELKKQPFHVPELVAACVERAQPLADRKRIRLHLEAVADEILVGDRELMEYAFYNLLTNAIKYSSSETEVKIWSRREGDHFLLSVQDEGIGMSETELRDIFRKFYRTRKAVASGETGTGIGLSVVEQIITHHGGRIAVTSAPGKGSCFTLVLPASVSAWTAEK